MTEADYICFLAKNISLGIYQNGGFYVLPEFNSHKKAVYFPDLNYSSKFWNVISKSKPRNLGEKFPKAAINEINSRIKAKKSKAISHKGITFDLLETEYGTVGSYFKFVMTQRKGNTNRDFEKTFLLMKLKLKDKNSAEIGSINWHKREAVVEYVLGKFKSTTSLSLAKKSEAYLTKLGFNNLKSLIKTSGWGKVTINGNDIKSVLTKKEEYVFKTLFKNQGKIVEFDEFTKVPSLYALSKLVENIRRKIRDLGINKEIILTVRGKGYSLV